LIVENIWLRERECRYGKNGEEGKDAVNKKTEGVKRDDGAVKVAAAFIQGRSYLKTSLCAGLCLYVKQNIMREKSGKKLPSMMA